MATFTVVSGAIRLRKFGGKFKAGVKYPLASVDLYAALKPLVILGDVLIEATPAEEAAFEKKVAGVPAAPAPVATAPVAAAPATPVATNEQKEAAPAPVEPTAPVAAPAK